jgi:hypothetical protein
MSVENSTCIKKQSRSKISFRHQSSNNNAERNGEDTLAFLTKMWNYCGKLWRFSLLFSAGAAN